MKNTLAMRMLIICAQKLHQSSENHSAPSENMYQDLINTAERIYDSLKTEEFLEAQK